MKKISTELHLVQHAVTTCEKAVEQGKQIGARVFWRPGGVVNWMLPEMDVAQILED